MSKLRKDTKESLDLDINSTIKKVFLSENKRAISKDELLFITLYVKDNLPDLIKDAIDYGVYTKYRRL